MGKITLSISDEAEALLLRLAGGSRKRGAYIERVIRALAYLQATEPPPPRSQEALLAGLDFDVRRLREIMEQKPDARD